MIVFLISLTKALDYLSKIKKFSVFDVKRFTVDSDILKSSKLKIKVRSFLLHKSKYDI